MSIPEGVMAEEPPKTIIQYPRAVLLKYKNQVGALTPEQLAKIPDELKAEKKGPRK